MVKQMNNREAQYSRFKKKYGRFYTPLYRFLGCEKQRLMDIEEVRECLILLVAELEKIDQTNYPLFKEQLLRKFINPSSEAKTISQ